MCNKKSLVFLVLLCVLSVSSLYAQVSEEQGAPTLPVEEETASASPTIVISDPANAAALTQSCFGHLVDSARVNLVCSYHIASFLLFQVPNLEKPDEKEGNLQIIYALIESCRQQKQTLEFVQKNATDAKRSEEVAKLLRIADNLVVFSEQLYFGLDNPGEEGAEAFSNSIKRFEQAGEELFANELK